jgi:hypothetical protein
MSTARTSPPIPLPGAIRQGGRRGWISVAVFGAALGVLLLLVLTLLSEWPTRPW